MRHEKRYRCLVCGFIAGGETPPTRCPACGAGADQFVETGQWLAGLLPDLYRTFLPHAVAAHFSNGAIPIALLFLAVFLATGNASFDTAALYVLGVGVASLPASLLWGIRDWKRRYGGLKLPVFRWKIRLGLIVSLLGALALFVRLTLPVPIGRPLPLTYYAYVGMVVAMFGLVVLLGHLGGKLVFFWKREVPRRGG